MNIYLPNKFKMLFIIAGILLVSNIVLAAPGCCVGFSTEQSKYCVITEEDDCTTYLDVDSASVFLTNTNYIEADGENLVCKLDGVEVDAQEKLCDTNICCVDTESYEGQLKKKISCRTEDDLLRTSAPCDSKYLVKDDEFCLINNKCERGVTREFCGRNSGVIYSDLSECNVNINLVCIKDFNDDGSLRGCHRGSEGEAIEAGMQNNVGYFRDFCYNVFDCQSFCSTPYKWECEELDLYKSRGYYTNNCGDIKDEEECDFDYVCSVSLKRCVTKLCKNSQTHSWCSFPTDPLSFPRDERNGVMHCVEGNEKIDFYCDDYREKVCVEDVESLTIDKEGNTEERITASCQDNLWESCFGKLTQNNCENNFCQWVSDTCLPRYPPGFEFWFSQFNENYNYNTFKNDKYTSSMCKPGSCEWSGDCEGSGEGPFVVDKSVVIDKPNSCGWGCCEITTNGFISYYAGDVFNCPISNLNRNYICTNIINPPYDPPNCPENVELSNIREGYAFGFCECGNTYCKISEGGVCKTV